MSMFLCGVVWVRVHDEGYDVVVGRQFLYDWCL